MTKKLKVAICMRTDLHMGRGKMIAQAGHAIVSLLEDTRQDPMILQEWMETGMKKVALEVVSREHLELIYKRAVNNAIPIASVYDAGLTVNVPGTLTCCAIGPMNEQQSKKITGSLLLLD
jgi:peptidyl-tRNA hydrolase, PTH2 family